MTSAPIATYGGFSRNVMIPDQVSQLAEPAPQARTVTLYAMGRSFLSFSGSPDPGTRFRTGWLPSSDGRAASARTFVLAPNTPLYFQSDGPDVVHERLGGFVEGLISPARIATSSVGAVNQVFNQTMGPDEQGGRLLVEASNHDRIVTVTDGTTARFSFSPTARYDGDDAFGPGFRDGTGGFPGDTYALPAGLPFYLLSFRPPQSVGYAQGVVSPAPEGYAPDGA